MDRAHQQTDEELARLERHLAGIYRDAAAVVQREASAFFAQFARLDQQKRKQVSSGALTSAEYKTWRKNKILYSQRFADLQQQIAMELLHTNETAIAYINGRLPEIYTINYNSLASQIPSGLSGYSFTLVDQSTVKLLSTENKSFLPYKKLDPAKDVPWNMRAINREVLKGILAGLSIPKMAGQISNVQAMNAEAAVRTARTITTATECQGRYDSYLKAESEGVITKKYWIDTAGTRTREWHREAGENYSKRNAIPIHQPFLVGGEQLMYPGDTSLGATGKNVYNCRCSMGVVVVGFKEVAI